MEKKIKILMLQKNVRQVDMARNLRVSRAAICKVVKGQSKSWRIRKALADILGIEFEKLWSEKR